MALVIKRTDTCVSSPADGARDVMSVDSQFRINNDNTSYAPLQTSSVYSLSNGGNYQPTTSTPKKFPEADFETIKPLNFAADDQCESEQEDSRQEARQDPPSTPPPLRDIECGDTQPTEDGADLNSSNNDQGKQPSPLSYSECYNSDSSCATTPLKWEPRSPLTPQTPLSSGGTPYSNVYPFALHSPDRDRERELAFIPRKDQNGVDLYFCHLCSFTGTTREIFSAHMSTHFEHACPHCDYTSRTEGRLKRHIKDFHSSSPPENFSGNKSPKAMPGRPKVYRCKQCEFVATEKLDFWAHARTHIKEDKLLQCPKCPFVTEYKHHLEYHLRNHFGSKPFKCNKCNYACVNKSMLNSHMKSHTNVYQYRCADCTYATKYCHSLKLHLRKYNHKPATVLNSDGSLPQGLDAEAAGLSLMMKRGPPRGPRGPRKDKLEAYLGQLMSMPHMGPRPGMNGLMSPYWPILGQFPNGFHHPPPLIPIPPHGNGMMPVLPQQRFAGPGMYQNQQLLTLKCTFCCFTTESKDDLANHMLKVHASENQDLFNAFGISSEALLDEQKERERRRSGENGTDDHPEDYSKKPRSEMDRPPSHPIHSLNMTESLHIRTDNDEVTKSSPRSWPPASTDTLEKETMNGCKSMPDLYFNSSKASTTSPDSGSKEDDSSDILRQMTLKFGGSSSKPREQKESPLDLTKPKALAAANYFAAVKRSYEQMEFNSHREHIMESVHRSQLDGSNVDDTASPAPRKRSRKGKAYKLDTIAMKLQGMSSDADPSAHEDTHSIGSHDDMEENSDHYSEKDADFHDITMRNRGDLNMSEERDDLSEEKAQPLPTSQSIPHGQIKEEQVSVGKDLEQLHRNLKLLNENETEKKEGMSAEDRCPSPVSDIRRCSMGSSMGLPDLPHFGKGGHTQTNIKDELALKAAYALKNSGTHSAVRKGAEIAWKILNPGQSSGAMAPQQNSVPSQNQDRREMHTNMPPTMYPSVCSTLPPSQKLTTKVNGVNGSLFSGSNAKKGGRNCDKYECSYCEIAFGDCVMYTMHMGYHGYKDPYKCNMCGHQSRDKVDFFLHIAREAHA